jgi:hypothetical protein
LIGKIMKIKSAILFATVTALLSASLVEAKRPTREAWSVTKTEDPITGKKTCVVAAYDQYSSSRYSRTGFLYPIVEKSEALGVLVGVSSGGRFRLPTGDILWRVDGLPHRILKAIDNPPSGNFTPTMAPFRTGNEATDKAIADAMASSSAVSASLTATSTVASGEKAVELLTEMLSGQGLIYRSATATPVYGLPSNQANMVGQFTADGLKPIPLDASFKAGLVECEIQVPFAPVPAITK